MNAIKFWTTEGFDVATYRWKLEERVNKQFNGSGSDNTGKCIYTYNELGFRGDSISKKGFKIMSIGCSLTEGVAVNDNETWPHHFSQLIPNSVDLNFGFGGRSNDYISRCLLTYYDLIKPDLVLIMYTFPYRKEYYTIDGNLEPFHTDPWGYFEEDMYGKEEFNALNKITHTENDMINWYKNHLLISNFLKLNNTPFFWNGSFLNDNTIIEDTRFDGNYNYFYNFGVDGVHPDSNHNKSYSYKLYDYIYKNFKHYLPNKCENITSTFI